MSHQCSGLIIWKLTISQPEGLVWQFRLPLALFTLAALVTCCKTKTKANKGQTLHFIILNYVITEKNHVKMALDINERDWKNDSNYELIQRFLILSA